MRKNDGWFVFYNQLSHYFKSNGIACNLFNIYWKSDVEDCNDLVEGLKVKDFGTYNTDRNIKDVISFLEQKNIDVIFNLNIPVNYLRRFLYYIKKRKVQIYIFELLHSTPNLVVQNKKILLREKDWHSIISFQDFLKWRFQSVYLFILKQIVKVRIRYALKMYDRIVVLSDKYVIEYLNLAGLESSPKVVAIPNPKPVLNDNILIKKKKQILYVGRLSEEKGVHRLLYIWKKVYLVLTDWELIIVGDGPDRNRCLSLSNKLSLDRIHFVGYQKSIPYIKEASILCLTSNVEGLPTVFLEAMELKTVIIGFNTFSAIYDLIHDNETGFIVPAFDFELYAKRIIQLAINDEKREKMANRAQELVKNYDITQVGFLWKSVFQELKLI